MKLPKDFFHPAFEGWQQYESGPLEEMRNAMPTLTFDGNLIIRQQALAFYPDAKLIIYKHPEWKPENLFVYALQKGDNVVWLNGTSPGIHQFNAAGHLVLNEKNVLDYLRFFCFFVHGDEGPFYLINNVDASYLPDCLNYTHEKEAGSHRDMFLQRYQSPRYFGTTTEATRRLSTLVMYANAVFLADFEVLESGMIEMKNDFPILADLPSKIDAPLVPTDTE